MEERTRKKISKWFWMIIGVPITLVVLLIVAVCLFAKIPSFEELENPDSKLATQVIAEGGEVLTTFHVENRMTVTFDELSENLVHAAVATEDSRFYNHSGIDFKGLARVLVKTLLMRDSSQGGGSTITQQLAKSLYPRKEGVGKVGMVWIKLKEWVTAVKIERDYTKDEIMTMYLNSIFFGSGAYGVRSAAETFFSKIPSELTVEESAMLVGMVNKPTRYNPALNPDKALVRRNFVIGQMEKAGFISKADRDSLREIPITLSYKGPMDHNSGLAPYFRDMIRRDMNAEKPKKSDFLDEEAYLAAKDRWDNDGFYGWLNKNHKPDGSEYNLDKDGLRIYTTIDYDMQKFAERSVAERLASLQKDFDKEQRYKKNRPFSNDVDEAVRERLMSQARKWSDRYRFRKKAGMSDAEILKTFSEPTKMTVFSWNSKGYCDTTMTPDDSIRYYKSILRAAFVAIEPGTGYVKAYVGGPNYRYFKFDNCRQGKRQVGSTIKPFLYTLAMQEGFEPCDRAVCAPQTFVMPDGTTWTPRSTDKEEWIGTTQTLAWGLSHSSNNFSAFLMGELGPYAMVKQMHQMGISSHVDEVYAICVGSAEIPVFEMVAAYNTFPSRGAYVTPIYVTRIEDNNGKVIDEFTNSRREAISPETAYTMVNMMRGVVDGGTGNRLRSIYGLKGPIAGKTGTTNDNSDGWFIGYTPQITAGAWVGGEDRYVHFNSTALGQGAAAALPIWGIWMKKCLADRTLSLSEASVFMEPSGGSKSFDCASNGTFIGGGEGGFSGENESAGSSHDEEEDYYFN